MCDWLAEVGESVCQAAAGLGRIITETLALRNVSVVALDLNEAEFDYGEYTKMTIHTTLVGSIH